MTKIRMLLASMILCIVSCTFTYSEEIPSDIFSASEIEWLENHPVIRVSPEDDYAPMSYWKDGAYEGFTVDYLNWISENFGLQFEYVYYDTWTEILDALRANEIDLTPAIVKTPERLKYLSYTDSYMDMPNVVLAREDFDTSITIDTLFEQEVGVLKDYAVHEYIMLMYSPEALHEYTDVKRALSDLSFGKIDALIVDLGQASFIIQEIGITNLRIVHDIPIDYTYHLRFAVPKDSAILASILNKALTSMPESTHQKLLNKWISLGSSNWFNNRTLRLALQSLAVLTLILLAAVTWSIILKKKDMELTRVNQLLEQKIEILHETQAQLIEVEKINALSRLVVGVAHEINTPLGNGISISSHIQHLSSHLMRSIENNHLSKQEATQIIQDISQSSQIALKSLNKAAKIIDTFKDASNYRHENTARLIDLNEEIERMVSIISKQQDFECIVNTYFEEQIEMVLPLNSLFQIVSALLLNSCQHGYSNSSGAIDITLKKEGEHVALAVKDYGTGISPEIQKKIFEPFYTTQRSADQIGLGLYGVHNIVTHILKGTIEVNSLLGTGATFIIRMPLHSET